MMLLRNVGPTDRAARLVLGTALLALGISGVVSAAVGVIVAALGVVLLVTGIARFCPLYSLVGFDTCRAGTGKLR